MNRSLKNQHRLRRRGSLTVELLVAGTLLGTVMAMIIPFMAQISKVNYEISDRELALRTVRDVITLLQSTSHATPQLPDDVSDSLQNAELSITEEADKDDRGLWTTVSISWENRFGVTSKPVALSFWHVNDGSEQ